MADDWTYADMYAVCCIEVAMRILTNFYRSGPTAFHNVRAWEFDNANLNGWGHDYRTEGGRFWGNRGV